MKTLPPWLIGLIIVLLLGGGGVAVYNMTRGLRNNNPGNIRHGSDWDGMSPDQSDPDFITFISPEYGIRALAKLLGNYQSLYGLNTIRALINRWAPPTENDTNAYVNDVAAKVGVSPDATISVVQLLPALVPAIIQHENGIQPYDSATLMRGISMV